MAFIFDTNIRVYALPKNAGGATSLDRNPFQAPRIDRADGNRVGFRLKQLLKAAGWTHVASGDGLALYSLAFGNVNDVITHEASGANGMRNNQAWFVLQHPGSSRQLGFQVFVTGDSLSTNWRIKYSLSAGFNLGTPSPIQMPGDNSETDRFILGGGSDASPFSDNWMQFGQYAQGTGWVHMAADTSPPYGFWVGGYSTNLGGTIIAGLFDPLVSGSYGAGDIDPHAFYFSKYGDSWNNELSNNSIGASWVNGVWSQQLNANKFGSRGDRRITYQRGGANTFNGKFDRMPVIWLDYSQQQVKGQSSLMYSTNYMQYELPSGKTYQHVTPRDTIQMGSILLPWNGTLPHR